MLVYVGVGVVLFIAFVSFFIAVLLKMVTEIKNFITGISDLTQNMS